MLTRRGFIAGGASAVTLLGSSRIGVAQGPVATRRSIRTMQNDDPDLEAYRRAVAAMKALPITDHRNWYRFAEIHMNYCPHANWYFLPWHRAYLVAFERLCREFSGKPDFALPYWDWTIDRQLPAAFRGDPKTNPLAHARPGFPTNQSLPNDMVGPAVMSRILNSPDFEAFGSSRPRGQSSYGPNWQRVEGAKTEFEFNAHDGVHSTLGGDMGTTERAARDPIFYLHHANVDRIWSEWNRRGNSNSSAVNWLNQPFHRNFRNHDGSLWHTGVGDLTSTAALGYQYEGEGPFAAEVNSEAAGDNQLVTHLDAYRRLSGALPNSMRALSRIELPSGGALQMAAVSNEQAASRERPVGVTVSLGRPLSELIRPAPSAAGEPSSSAAPRVRQCIWAIIRDIDAPTDLTTRVRVFCNRDGLSPATQLSDEHYVTSLSFFGIGHSHQSPSNASAHSHHGHGAKRSAPVCVDLTPCLSRIRDRSQFRDDKIVVQFMPVCQNGTPGSVVRPRRVEVVVI